MLENIRLSFQGIWSHKLRSFLTMLGIIIGIASIIAIVSTIKGTNEQIKENLIGSGNNTVTVTLYQGEGEYEAEYMGTPPGVPVISDETLQSILDIPTVENASRFLRRRYNSSIFYKAAQLQSCSLLGIDSNYLDTCGYILKKGRGFVQNDFKYFKKVALIDSAVASELFPDTEPVGKTIEIQGEPFIVIGVVEQSNAFKPVINSVEDYMNYMGDTSSTVYIPRDSWPIIFAFDEPENIVFKATSTDDMSTAGQKVADILNSTIVQPNNGMPEGGDMGGGAEGSYDEASESTNALKYKSKDILEKAKNLQNLSQSTNQQLIWIASISLLVGGIGVMNIMLVSVTERTREIGLKKAIGARNNVILGQFLTEAAVLTSLGGLLGVIVGIILAKVISSISSTPVAISVPAIAASVIFSIIIGVIFGLLPSIKASKLNPIDALRHE